MKCPFCGDQESKVVDSRHSEDGLSIRRRRECLNCQRRFTTYDIVESLPIIVVKRDGSRQAFDRNKILNSMVRAFDKRQVEMADSSTGAAVSSTCCVTARSRAVCTITAASAPVMGWAASKLPLSWLGSWVMRPERNAAAK